MTGEDVPDGARPATRVLILDERQRLLLLDARNAGSGERWWLAPGGGLEPGETFEAAARREIMEETGLSIELGPWVWMRRHRYEWEGRHHDQYERYFVARLVGIGTLAPTRPDSYIVGERWWTLDEIRASTDDFTPRRLAALLEPILAGRYPEVPFDCGV